MGEYSRMESNHGNRTVALSEASMPGDDQSSQYDQLEGAYQSEESFASSEMYESDATEQAAPQQGCCSKARRKPCKVRCFFHFCVVSATLMHVPLMGATRNVSDGLRMLQFGCLNPFTVSMFHLQTLGAEPRIVCAQFSRGVWVAVSGDASVRLPFRKGVTLHIY